MRRGLLLLLAPGLLAGPARADTDAHVCTAPGYLALEVQRFTATQAHHLLRIFYVGGATRGVAAFDVPLPEFTLHGMRCEPDRVVLRGWQSQVTVMLAEAATPRVRSEPVAPGAPVPAGMRQDSLALLRRSRAVEVPSPRADRRYRLETVYREQRLDSPSGPSFRHHTTSTLIETDASGIVLSRRVVQHGYQTETVD